MNLMNQSINPNIIKIARKELTDDITELIYISNSNLKIINNRIQKLNKISGLVSKESYNTALEAFTLLIKKYTDIIENAKQTDLNDYNLLLKLKKGIFNRLRILQSQFSAAMIMLDYQSPSFGYSIHSEAGLQTGRIVGTINDYKRDGHIDEIEYEKKFVKEYIDAPFKSFIHSYMISSGMSAFTTILNFLTMEGKLNEKVMMGQSSYFQYKGLLMNMFKSRIIPFDETDTKKILTLFRQHKPSAIFIDSLSNAASIPVPNLRELIEYFDTECTKETYLIIDNTCLSFFCQPFMVTRKLKSKLHILIFESLMKYHHFGFDHACGGIIIAKGKDASKIFEYRKNLGTNIADFSVYSFPNPNKKILKIRLLRLQRNALVLSLHLKQFINNNVTPVENIIYPAFSDHPSYKWTKNSQFPGSFFNFKFRKQYRSVTFYKKFIKNVILIGKKEGIEIIAGTSFGLNNTRISLTSLWTNFGEPFIRIAPGNEDLFSIEKLKKVFTEAIIHTDTKIPAKFLISINKLKRRIGIDKIY
jgi:cystathionine beta-lyase/cystathionine gamma-synthase